ncbi:MAG: Tfp pilus assembly protein FimT/FimU [Cyanobium sp.]
MTRRMPLWRTLLPLRPRGGAFTVMELAVAVAMLSILCGVVIDAGLREWRREQVNTVVLELAGWLESVRRSAIKGYSCTVTIANGENGSFPRMNGDALATVRTEAGGACGTVGTFHLTGVNSSPGFLVTTTNGSGSMTFTPAGTLFLADSTQRDKMPLVIRVSLNDHNPDPERCLQLEGMLGLIDVGPYRNGTCEIGGKY